MYCYLTEGEDEFAFHVLFMDRDEYENCKTRFLWAWVIIERRANLSYESPLAHYL